MCLQMVLVCADWSLAPFIEVFLWCGPDGGAVLSTPLRSCLGGVVGPPFHQAEMKVSRLLRVGRTSKCINVSDTRREGPDIWLL